MISDRQEKEREIRKDQILESALKVFKISGIEGTTMDEIAKHADFGKATLYSVSYTHLTLPTTPYV